MIAAYLPWTTARLRLRAYRTEDLKTARPISQDPELRRWIPSGALSEVDYQRFIADSSKATATDLLVELADRSAVIGEASFAVLEDGSGIDIGWLLLPVYQGQGYATEIGQALIDIAFSKFQAERVQAVCHSGNEASLRVMQRLGMTRAEGFDHVQAYDGTTWVQPVFEIRKAEEA